MAEAELTGIADFVKVETCGHFMCSCKPALDDEPMKGQVKVHHYQMDGERVFTPLQIFDDKGGEKTVNVSSVQRPEQVKDAFIACEGPEVLGGTVLRVVCGAVYRLERKK